MLLSIRLKFKKEWQAEQATMVQKIWNNGTIKIPK